MLTIFTTTKPFRGHIGVIQTNAIQSWLLLHPKPEVILLGSEEGTAEVASRFGIRHVAEVECNDYGTSLASSIFSIAQDIATYQLMCYVNADIILMSDFLPAVSQIKVPSFLLIGRRWDIDLEKPLDFSSPGWETQLRQHLAEAGRRHGPSGLDYFVFRRGTYYDMPPFAIGRTAWDNWIPYKARKLKLPLIDGTEAITVVHQNHDYSHNLSGETGVWKGPEASRNLELLGGRDHAFTLEHVTFLLSPKGLRPALTMRHLYFRMRAIPILCPHLHFLVMPFKILEKCLRAVRVTGGTA